MVPKENFLLTGVKSAQEFRSIVNVWQWTWSAIVHTILDMARLSQFRILKFSAHSVVALSNACFEDSM